MPDPTAGPSVTPIYISAAASRNNASVARTRDGLVLFASGHLIALWDSDDEASRGVKQTLAGHNALVSALKLVQGQDQAFVSGDAQGKVKLWTEIDGKWTTLASLSGHSGSVSAVEAIHLADGTYLVVTGGSDSTIRVWLVRQDGTADQVQTIDCKGKIPLELALSYLPSSSGLALAVGGTETKIQLYATASPSQPNFQRSISLDGHTDWVRCLSFTTPLPETDPTRSVDYDISPGEVLLASGSQDNYIRLWRLTRLSRGTSTATAPKPSGLAALDELEKRLAESSDPSSSTSATGAGPEGEELRVKAHDFVVEGDGEFSVAAEAVLLAHDAWVTGLNWAPATRSKTLRLLSASADRSLILWTPLVSIDPSTSASTTTWTSTHRFGEFTSVTNLGFFGALWGLDTRTVLASGWGGSWHVWKQEAGQDDDGEWVPQVAVSGHLGNVRQVAWEPNGEYLLSASHDMSTRLHAPWRRTLGEKGVETWHELGRPQIHGYPLSSLAFTSRLQFISGADEKIVRVFDAPKVFVSSLKKLSQVVAGDEADRPMAANVPPLGLSNRAIATQADADQLAPASNDPFDAILPVNFSVQQHPPLEEQLLGSTLWPETEKLYGHSFELVSLCSAHSSPLIATACKATLPAHALIRLYDTRTWQPVRTEGSILEGHALTITKLEFSRDDRYLLSVSRDRTWRVYEKIGDDLGYRPIASSKSHARIIWDTCWSSDDSFFATASRDKTAKIWIKSESTWECAETLKFDEAATSIATTYLASLQIHLLAVGLENGHIHLFSSTVSSPAQMMPLAILSSSIAHVLAVTTLAFRPSSSETPLPAASARLASGSEDRSVRIFDIAL
ncbi:hypothetical protein JCM10212_003917 [Sporobolomyces blumeae]